MGIVSALEVPPQPITEEGAKDATIRWLLSRPEGARTFAMRFVEVAPGGSTPLHTHAWEHEVFVLDGQGEAVTGGGATAISPGDAALVVPQELHQFRDTSDGLMHVLCLIPLPDEG